MGSFEKTSLETLTDTLSVGQAAEAWSKVCNTVSKPGFCMTFLTISLQNSSVTYYRLTYDTCIHLYAS